MPRGFSKISRFAAAAARQQQANTRAQLQASAQIARAAVLRQRNDAKQRATDYAAQRLEQAAYETADLRQTESALQTILSSINETLTGLNFRAMEVTAKLPHFDAKGLDQPIPTRFLDEFMPPPLGVIANLLPSLRLKHAQKQVAAHLEYREAVEQASLAEKQRIEKLEKLTALHQKACAAADAEAKAKNAEIAAFKLAYESGDRDAVIAYFTLTFEADQLPGGLPTLANITFDAESKQLVIERQLPTIAVIPKATSFRYVKKTDEILPVVRKPTEVKSLYAQVLSQIALRSLRVALAADRGSTVKVFAFNGYVNTIDPQTGKNVSPTLISVVATRASLKEISFNNVEATSCLRGLKALVSRSAHELEPVRPLVVFDMVDRRFIDKTDILSDLESRPNLADMTPSEFETLMTNLFEKMGLETRLTQASRDGGVDCVAWDMRPVIGGKVVIQAKRYRNTVGVSAVRDLYGTMMNEGAAKGILVATSGYGETAYEFVKNKPLELITGSNLLSMLEEYAGIKARIEFPQTWIDGETHF